MPSVDRVLWTCPSCLDVRWYTRAQVANRKRCVKCAGRVSSARKVAAHAQRQLEEVWRAGHVCKRCGRRFWQARTDGGVFRRCAPCRKLGA